MSDKGEIGTSAGDATQQRDAGMAGSPAETAVPAPKALSAAAQRALEEAEARRLAYEAQVAALPRELGGRGGKEPGRYGDWEVKGIATDF